MVSNYCCMSTSLSLQDEDLAKQIRETDGKNNAERLRNWAEDFETDDQDRTEALDIYEHREEIEEIVDDRVEELRRKL